jgi:hypothetical protein
MYFAYMFLRRFRWGHDNIQERLASSGSLNADQQALANLVLDSDGHQICAFVDAPAGTGNTFTANYIVDKLSLQNRLTVCVATSGIAAQLFKDNKGRTFHSCFNCPLTLHEHMSLAVEVGSDEGDYLAACDLIIWDESVMAHRYMLEALDRLFRQLKKRPGKPFGGTSILLLGDWRQQLPVIKHAQHASQIINATLQASRLWHLFSTLHLTENMRLRPAPGVSARQQRKLENYAEWILQVGDGLIKASDETECIPLPRGLCMNGDSIHSAIEWVYADLAQNAENPAYFASRRIFAPHHTSVNAVNAQCIENFPGVEHALYSVDTPDIDETSPDVTVVIVALLPLAQL